MSNDITIINIREYLSVENDDFGEDLSKILSEFSCPKNYDVEEFLINNSIEFTKKNQSITYLVFSNEDVQLLGYFTLAIKPITVRAEQFSSTIKNKLNRVGELDSDNQTYTLSAYLIAQLGKNFNNNLVNNISGENLLNAAIHTIRKIQYLAGGKVVFLETQNTQKLLDFYTERGFRIFADRETQSEKKGSQTLIQLLKII